MNLKYIVFSILQVSKEWSCINSSTSHCTPKQPLSQKFM